VESEDVFRILDFEKAKERKSGGWKLLGVGFEFGYVVGPEGPQIEMLTFFPLTEYSGAA
jgi:hypothetical protein